MAAAFRSAPLIPEIHQRVDQENQAKAIQQKKNIYSHWMFSHWRLGFV
jgi:hypothetical protein